MGKLWLGIAFLLVSGLSFEAGMLQKSLTETEPLVIAAPPALSPALPEQVKTDAVSVSESTISSQKSSPQDAENCAFVGSKNSNKYHLPSSRCAKQIKQENRVCFSSIEAAKARGYIAGCLE